MNLKPGTKVLLAYPWTIHIPLALFFMTIAVFVIYTIEMLGTDYPWHIKWTSIIGFTWAVWVVLENVLALLMAIILGAKGQWKGFVNIMKGGD